MVGDLDSVFDSVRLTPGATTATSPTPTLGHAPTTIKDRHYTRPPQELLDETVSSLGDQLDLK